MNRPDPQPCGLFTCVIDSDLQQTQVVRNQICDELKRHGYDEHTLFGVKLALEEALANAVKHGNRCDISKKVTVSYSVDNVRVVVTVRDEGVGFVLESVPDCTSVERLPVPNGRGIMLMKAYMDEVCYRDCGREVYFMKRKDTKCCAGMDMPPSPVRRTIYFAGRVQGVGFRFAAQEVASRHPVTGLVRNLADGRVELVAEGVEADLDGFQKELEQIMRAHIREVQTAVSPATGQFVGFTIAH
jgi:serine/threonine-protein kinase RsbW